ncbi:MAG: serine protein kinase RIO [Thaumarchaeota archaeon]|nr:serine protein kinase RIO [Nitrososphaerota archaeon]
MKYVRERDEQGEPDLQKFHKAAERVDKRDRVILKNEEERSVFEEVFDRKTLMILYDLSNSGTFAYLNGVISSGKEARVYWGVKKDNTDVAVKIYLVSSSDYKKRLQYVEGDPRFTKIRKDSRGIAEVWARKEFINLKQAFNAGAPVPQPFDFKGNVVIMQFIGTEGIPAPRLIDAKATKKDYTTIVNAMELIYQKAELVHSDLSEYNVMKLDNKVILFDFGSAVSSRHPSAEEFLKRDITNVNRFFQKRGVSVTDEAKLLKRISGDSFEKDDEPAKREEIGLEF